MNEPDRDELHSVLFAELVMQQANLAMMMLGRIPNPETGQTLRDLEGAQLFINQLEMLESKTKGNLSAEEAALLQQTLMTLRMAFVEAVNQPASAAAPTTASPTASAAGETKSPPTESAGGEEATKRFTKKYA